jgi:uncharacterized protein
MPIVSAVSISVPRLVEVNGRPILTSIIRDPAPGAVRFGLGGPEGNLTAVHTEEVLATVSENYDHWARELGVPRDSWPYAYWGENLTISGVDEHQLRIGDRLAIGKSAIFEVTSPRIPCFKLSWRLGQPDSFLNRLIQSGLTGFYLRVRIPGDVMAGDPVVVESDHTDNVTVADLSQLLHNPTVDVERLRRVLATPGLGHQATGMLSHRIVHLTDGARVRRGRWAGWRRFQVADARAETADVRSYLLRSVDDEPIAEYRAGQFLSIRFTTTGGHLISRPWSLSDYEEGGRSYRLTIRHSIDGWGSGHMHTRVRVGDELEVRSPAGSFVLDRSTLFRVTLISAGIGITPLVSMLKAHACRTDMSPLVWIHSTRNASAYALRGDVDRLLRANPSFRSLVLYTVPRPEDRVGVDYHQQGRLTPERLTSFLGESYRCSPFGRDIELPSQTGLFYICGPTAFERDIRAALLAWGVDPLSIHSEHFTPAGAPAAASIQSTCTVKFVRSRKEAVWTHDNDLSLLELAEANGLEPPSSCRVGSCHTCENTLLAGNVTYDRAPEVPPAPGRVLICCARPNTDVVELDL